MSIGARELVEACYLFASVERGQTWTSLLTPCALCMQSLQMASPTVQSVDLVSRLTPQIVTRRVLYQCWAHDLTWHQGPSLELPSMSQMLSDIILRKCLQDACMLSQLSSESDTEGLGEVKNLVYTLIRTFRYATYSLHRSLTHVSWPAILKLQSFWKLANCCCLCLFCYRCIEAFSGLLLNRLPKNLIKL